MTRPQRAVAAVGTLGALAPAAVFLVCSLSADLVAIAGHDPIGIWRILPAGPVRGSWVNAEVSSTTLFLVAIALARAKRIGYWLALAMLGAAVVVQGTVRHHPIAAVAAIGVGLILVATRRRYIVRTGRTEVVIAAALIGLGGLAVVLDGAIIGRTATTLPRIGRMLATWLDSGSVGRMSLSAGLAVVLVGARIGLMAAIALILDPAPDPRPAAERERARAALRRLARGSLRPYLLGPMVEPFATPDGDGALGFARVGRTAVTLGDSAGEDAGAAGRGFDEWSATCRRLDWQPAIYQASDAFAARLRPDGWHGLRIGTEAIVDPLAFDLSSPSVANLRHTVTRARKGGLAAAWSLHGMADLPAAVSPDRLVELDELWRRDAGPRLGFTVGEFHLATLAGCLVAVAIDRDERLEAFVVLRPTGTDRGWMLDVMRRRRGSTPGAVELCMVTALEALRGLGVTRLSLGLAPLAGLRGSDGPLAERLLARLARLLGPLYDVGGLAFFKGKFDPVWEPRSLLVPHRTAMIGAAMALVRLHLGGSWPSVARSLAEPLAAGAHRRRAPVVSQGPPTAPMVG